MSSTAVPSATASPPPRGFVVNRNDGQTQLPGSLHNNRLLSLWLSLAEPGVVQAFTGKVELGQGILTALQLLVAEELDVAIAAVRINSASTTRGPDEGMTSGSLSVQDSGGALRHACAALRELARKRAAATATADTAPADTAVAAEGLDVRNGHFYTASGQEIGSYWSLVNNADLAMEYTSATPKPASARRLLGRTTLPRLDLADKVFGQARFIHDLRLPGMQHGRVLRPPTLDASLLHWPADEANSLPEGVRCWRDGRFIAVVAGVERDAEAAAAKLAARGQWQAGEALPNAQQLPAFLQSAPHQTTVTMARGETATAAARAAAAPLPASTLTAAPDHESGQSNGQQGGQSSGPTSWPAAWPQSSQLMGQHHQAQYFKPYLAHASIGTCCAIALWNGQQLQVWTHSQGIHNLRDDLVLALSRQAHPVARTDIHIHHVEGAGCYGHNGADDVAFDAVLMALQCPGQAVRVLWSRADELTHSPYGSDHLVELHARLDEHGQLSHWQHELWANGYSSRPGRATTPTLLAASQRAHATPLPLPINPPLAAGGGAERNAVPPYEVPNLLVLNNRLTVMPLRTSALRALGAFANVFAIESFMDELAQQSGQDPLAFRRRHLADPRSLAVLEAVVQRSEWWLKRATEPEGIGHGLAWARYKNTGAWCAVIARVEVAEEVRVLNLDIAVDVGMVVDLDGVINQIEGGAVQSVSWTLKEQVQFDEGGITSTDWPHYPVLRFSEVPAVRVHVLDRPDEPPLGAGEAAQGPVAAALANAVHNALGVRVRTLPLNADNILRAIHRAEAAP